MFSFCFILEVAYSFEAQALYVNDLSDVEAAELKRQLISDPVMRHYLLNYHERAKNIFPSEKHLEKHL